MSGFAPDPKQVPSVEDIQRAREAGILGGPEAPVPNVAEVGTPAAADDPELRTALRMVTRLHVDARDIRNGNIHSSTALAGTLNEAAEVIEGLLRRLR